MARKNNKKKYKRQHKEAIRADKKQFLKFEAKLKETIEEKVQKIPEHLIPVEKKEIINENTMVIEPVKRHKKIRKNKMFQKRSITLEKKKNRKRRNAPILVTKEERMDLE